MLISSYPPQWMRIKCTVTVILWIIVHPLAQFDALFAAPLFGGNPAIEIKHITLGECPYMSVRVIKPACHFSFLFRVFLDKTELARYDPGALKNDFDLAERRITRGQCAHGGLAGLIEKRLAVIARHYPKRELDILPIAALD